MKVLTVPKISTLTRYVGVDPGQAGGVAVIYGDTIEAYPMPESELDTWNLFTRITPMGFQCRGSIELVHSMPQQGVASSFKFGRNYGFVRACMIASGIGFSDVQPKRWQQTLDIVGRKADEPVGALKLRLLAAAQQRFPTFHLWTEPKTKGKQLAVCDAMLLAEYCRLINEGYHQRSASIR